MPKKVKGLEKLSSQERDLLKQAQDICDIIKTPGWTHIVNFVQQSIVWPDPKTFHSREEVIVPYTESYGAAELARKLGEFVNNQESVIKSLTNKLDEESDAPDYRIGN